MKQNKRTKKTVIPYINVSFFRLPPNTFPFGIVPAGPGQLQAAHEALWFERDWRRLRRRGGHPSSSRGRPNTVLALLRRRSHADEVGVHCRDILDRGKTLLVRHVKHIIIITEFDKHNIRSLILLYTHCRYCVHLICCSHVWKNVFHS